MLSLIFFIKPRTLHSLTFYSELCCNTFKSRSESVETEFFPKWSLSCPAGNTGGVWKYTWLPPPPPFLPHVVLLQWDTNDTLHTVAVDEKLAESKSWPMRATQKVRLEPGTSRINCQCCTTKQSPTDLPRLVDPALHGTNGNGAVENKLQIIVMASTSTRLGTLCLLTTAAYMHWT
jgi:hypothetical protein